MMTNSRWLKNICAYNHSLHSYASALNIINFKIQQRSLLLSKYGFKHSQYQPPAIPSSISHILLYEARHAKHFWKQYAKILPAWCSFKSRQPRGQDVTNHLLDIGYHHISNKISGILTKHSISPALGIFHAAQDMDDQPLVYDLMEIFRAYPVEVEVAKFFRLKKKPFTQIKPEDISKLLHRINIRLQHKHYLRSFKQCHTQKYIMQLQILKFISSVNHHETFKPTHIPSRHDTRCS